MQSMRQRRAKILLGICPRHLHVVVLTVGMTSSDCIAGMQSMRCIYVWHNKVRLYCTHAEHEATEAAGRQQTSRPRQPLWRRGQTKSRQPSAASSAAQPATRAAGGNKRPSQGGQAQTSSASMGAPRSSSLEAATAEMEALLGVQQRHGSTLSVPACQQDASELSAELQGMLALLLLACCWSPASLCTWVYHHTACQGPALPSRARDSAISATHLPGMQCICGNSYPGPSLALMSVRLATSKS